VAPVPAGQSRVRVAGDGPGAPAQRHSRLIRYGLPPLVGLLAIALAQEAGVEGKAASRPLAQVGVAAVVLFAVAGFGPTRLLLPAGLRRHEPLWVLPVGACVVCLAMTVLGYAYVPFKLSLAVVLAAGAVLGVVAWRRSGPPGGFSGQGFAWPVYLAILLAAIALIPLFRAGFATVEGQGQDAHLAVGTAQFLQKHHPLATAPEEPVDQVPLVWRSKPPIYYVLGAVATLSGMEVFESISTLAAVLLGLAAVGFFLVARELLRAPPWVALCAMGLVGLDRMVLHTVMHPYFNQTWGFFAMPFALVLGWWVATERTRGGIVLLGLFVAVCAFAYPLALPVVLIPMAFMFWSDRRALSPGRLWRRIWHGPWSLLWMVPLSVILVIPVAGVVEKAVSGVPVVFDPNFNLYAWGGDLNAYFEEQQFFGFEPLWLFIAAAPVLGYGIWRGLRDRPPALRNGLLALMAFAAVFAFYFRLRPVGWYFHFKVLAFVAPLALVVAAVGLSRARRLGLGVVALVALLFSARHSALQELGSTFDQLPRYVLELRTIDAALPAGKSIRLDLDPQEQNWAAYMLHGQPLCSRLPLLDTSYPHVRESRNADYILAKRDAPLPRDALPFPVMQTGVFALYKVWSAVQGPKNCSRKMVQTVERITVS
jgi:hypothetical protein